MPIGKRETLSSHAARHLGIQYESHGGRPDFLLDGFPLDARLGHRPLSVHYSIKCTLISVHYIFIRFEVLFSVFCFLILEARQGLKNPFSLYRK